MSVPIYDGDGALFAPSMTEAARRLGCTQAALYAHVTDYRDGYMLVSLPQHAGQRGGARPAPPPPTITCGHPERRHQGGGRCTVCYGQRRRALGR